LLLLVPMLAILIWTSALYPIRVRQQRARNTDGHGLCA
jgi:hypothetical protein